MGGSFASLAEVQAGYGYQRQMCRRVGWLSRVSGDPATVSEFARQVMAKRAGPNAGATVLAVAGRTYEELAEVAAPLIGQAGLEALMSRAVHLARRQYPWLDFDGAEPPAHDEDAFAQVARRLEQAEAGAAVEAAGAVFGLAAGLLATLIGEALTASLLYRAWPDAFPMPAKRSDNE